MTLVGAPTVRDHRQALGLSSGLTQYWRRTQRPMATDVTPESVVKVLNEVGICPILMGTYGVAGWRSEPRATLDVDVLVRKRDIGKAVRALAKAFPKLVIKDLRAVTRFEDPHLRKVVIDVMKPSEKVYALAFRHTIRVGKTHEIPDLEMQ